MFAPAKQAEIVRANQKDEFYVSYIRNSLTDVVQSLLGARSWLQWRNELETMADLLYFGLTTFAGYQTIGEEYVNVVQVDDSLRKVPSPLRRATMILLHVAAPFALDQLLTFIQRKVNELPECPPELSRLAGFIPTLRHIVTVVHRCHLAAFYLRGVFYHFAKRLTGIRYLQVRRGSSDVSQSNYRLLGWLSLIQLSFSFVRHLYRLYTLTSGSISQVDNESAFMQPNASTPNSSSSEQMEDYLVSSGRKCSLCLEGRKHSTATPCGHLFCWDCIFEWCSTKAECPLCREPVRLSRLVYLQNYI